MTRLALIRHGPTLWNAEKRLQGRSDVPLSAEGLETVARWRLPPTLSGFRWLSSPLRRARETASLLGLEARVDDRMVEMSFGRWEGRRLPDLRAELGAEMREMEDRGLDFKPPQGDSPREVFARVRPLLAQIAAERIETGCVTHKGVIRAIVAVACGWNMLGKPPVKLDWSAAQVLRLDPEGMPRPETWNLSLTEDDQP